MTASNPQDDLAITEQLSRIRHHMEETDKFRAETHKLIAESEKFAAEQRKLMVEAQKLDRDRLLSPVVIVTSFMSAVLAAILVAIVNVMTRQ